MIAELLEAFGNRLHPRFVVSFQLWLFPSHFGTTYLSPSVNPRLPLHQEGQKGSRACLGSTSALSQASEKTAWAHFHLPAAAWSRAAGDGQCHLPRSRGPGCPQRHHSCSGSSTGVLGQSPLSRVHGSCVALCTLKPFLSAFFKHRELGGK